jgi:pimeloyl-ACP methyl ester carboxylesterase
MSGEERRFETPYGPIVLWGEPQAFAREAQRPLLLAIAGAFAIPRGPLFQLAPALGEAADVVAGHLPGNHCPTLISASVGTYAAAYSHVVRTAFAQRRVVVCGSSIGGLVALGMRAPQIPRMVVTEPPLVMSKVWPMRANIRQRLAAAPDDADLRAFCRNVFGVSATAVEERRYDWMIEMVSRPTHVLVGDRPLYPERALEKLPSLVDEPERKLMAAHPLIRLSVLPDAGHNVLQESAPGFLAALREAVTAPVTEAA